MNELSTQKRDAVRNLLLAGNSVRNIANVIGCSKVTVSRYRGLMEVSAQCGCGKAAGHNGWCWFRMKFSPVRSGWIQRQWHKRADPSLAGVIGKAVDGAKALGHKPGPFVWSASTAASVAYSVCAVCGSFIRVFSGESQWERYQNWPRFAGKALTVRCMSPEQRAAESQARKQKLKEKKSWQSAKQTLRTVRTILRRPNSRTTASPPEPTSPA